MTEQEREWEGIQFQPWPDAARMKTTGYLPTIDELFAAYGWCMESQAPPQSSPDIGDESLRRHMQELFFPLPMAVDTDYELRALIAKVVVGDGLWSDFRPGIPFNEYTYKYSPPVSNETEDRRVYSDDEARQLGEMFAIALERFGAAKLWETCLELAHVLILPR